MTSRSKKPDFDESFVSEVKEDMRIGYLPVRPIDDEWNELVFFKSGNALFHGYKYGINGRSDLMDSNKHKGYTGTPFKFLTFF